MHNQSGGQSSKEMSSTTTIRWFPTHSWVLVSAWGLLNPARVLGRAHTVIILKRVCVCVAVIFNWNTHNEYTHELRLMQKGSLSLSLSLSTELRFPVSIFPFAVHSQLQFGFISIFWQKGSVKATLSCFMERSEGGNPWRRRRRRHQRHRLPPNRMTSRHFNDRKRKLIYPKVFHLHSCCCWDDVTERERQLQEGEE